MFPEGRALEFLLAAIVALIVVGPKDLPVLLRKLGQFMAKVRSMAAEFRASFDEMARQSELDELRKEVEAMRKGQFADIASSAAMPEMAQTFDEISQELNGAGAQLHPPMSYQYATETPIEAQPTVKPKRARSVAAKAPAKPVAKPSARTSATPRAVAKAEPKSAQSGKTVAKAPAKPRARKTARTEA